MSKSTRPLRKSSSAPPPSKVKRGGSADSEATSEWAATDDSQAEGAGRSKARESKRAPDCPFCNFKHFRVIAGNDLALALRDEHPVSEGHTLVLPRRHVSSWFEVNEDERLAIIDLLDRVRERLDTERHPDGYNIGINDGEAAGQTVMHVHVHLIPRYQGDVADPRGGVRHVIPDRGNYLAAGDPEDAPPKSK
jgi:diadenosine tetraphosphate (Ap4A) HIT family hydrolase